MSTTDIETAKSSPVHETHVAAPVAQGWLGWYKPNNYTGWMQVYGMGDEAQRDSHRLPYPMFASREDVIVAGKRCLGSQAGTIKTVEITL